MVRVEQQAQKRIKDQEGGDLNRLGRMPRSRTKSDFLRWWSGYKRALAYSLDLYEGAPSIYDLVSLLLIVEIMFRRRDIDQQNFKMPESEYGSERVTHRIWTNAGITTGISNGPKRA